MPASPGRLNRTAGRVGSRLARRFARPVRARAPVAVGGVGGSGTRLIAQILADLGYAIGDDLNGSNDNLTFTLLFKTPRAVDADDAVFDDLWTVFRSAMTRRGAPLDLRTAGHWRDIGRILASEGRALHSTQCLQERLGHLEKTLTAQASGTPRLWGWKEPNTHLVVDRLLERDPSLSYIHVVRHGVDVAFSANQNQLEMWGPRILGRPVELTPHDSLAYWVATHRRIEALAAREPRRVLLLNYDALCHDPDPHLRRMLSFLNIWPRRLFLPTAAARITPQPTHGRYRGQDLSQFDSEDLAYVRYMGFATD